jgi:hypothetical protein
MAGLSFRLLPLACFDISAGYSLRPCARHEAYSLKRFGLGPKILSKATDVTSHLFLCLDALSSFRDI